MKFLAFNILVLLFTININGQCINGVKTYPIYKKGAELVDNLDNEGVEIVRIEYDLIFSSKESYRELTSDWTYSIIGFADNGVKDLNMKLYEYDDLLDKWKMVAEDNLSETYAVINYKPTTTAHYKIEVIAKEFYEGYNSARYGLILFHE